MIGEGRNQGGISGGRWECERVRNRKEGYGRQNEKAGGPLVLNPLFAVRHSDPEQVISASQA